MSASSINQMKGSFKPTFDHLFLKRMKQFIPKISFSKKAHALDPVLFGIYGLMPMIKILLIIHSQILGCSRYKSYRYK